jgi:hypothetical protein
MPNPMIPEIEGGGGGGGTLFSNSTPRSPSPKTPAASLFSLPTIWAAGQSSTRENPPGIEASIRAAAHSSRRTLLGATQMNIPVHLNRALIPPEFAIQSKPRYYAVEHVLTYSGALTQVPYNQQLEAGLRVVAGRSFDKIKFDKIKVDSGDYGSLSMADQNDNHETRQLVADAVSKALAAQLPQLQSQIVQQVLESLPSQSNAAPATPREYASALVNAVSSIQAGSTQKEILRALLDAGSGYCSRIALFVVKAGAASGWQSRGFGGEEIAKDFPLDLNAGPASDAYRNRAATAGNISAMDSPFVEHFGRPTHEQVLVLPLALKDKVAALVYADGGDSGKLETDALELLVAATSAWLEVTSLRKQVAAKEDSAAASRVESPAPAVQTISTFSDPFASHAPKHVPASAPAHAEPASDVVEVAAAHASAAAAPAAATDPLAGLSPEDADVHRKAQRFARLLVDEIKLYNQAKVAEGRRNKDLYDRLKEDIDKSRGTFQKRYGNTAAASGEYFYHELLRSLAEDDISIMGSNFHR